MRRFAIVFVSVLALSLMATPASAQLNITSGQTKVEKIGTLRSTYAFLYREGTDYFLSVRSSNQFDGPCLFFLGENASSAIQTLNDLCELCETMDDNAAINVEDAKGQKAVLVKKKMLGKPYFDISMEGQAGTSNLTLVEFKKAIDLIKKELLP